ncbi:MAG: hypothetical protein ABIJ00_12495 [Candidatus Eisenbacteria bacterium]
MNELEHHKKAFEFYYGIGEGRSYSKVAKEFGMSIAAVKLWGRSFGWKRRVGERDGEVARSMADQSLSDGVERAARNRKIVEMGLIKVAQAIAEGKVKPTITDLDRLIRLEEFLRQEDPDERPRVIFEWRDVDSSGRLKNKVGDTGDASTAPTEEEG